MVYFSASIPGFIPAEWKDDGTYTEATWPADAVLLTPEEELMYRTQSSPDGYQLGSSSDGRPAWVLPPPPTDAEIAAANTVKLQQATQLAAAQKSALASRVGTLLDAVELEMATPEEEAELPVRQVQLLAWKKYAIYLGRVTLQEGWALTVAWPTQPAEGMDLTVSASAPETV